VRCERGRWEGATRARISGRREHEREKRELEREKREFERETRVVVGLRLGWKRQRRVENTARGRRASDLLF
jgi:hypothetical protein